MMTNISTMMSSLNDKFDNKPVNDVEDGATGVIVGTGLSNVVSEEKLRAVQQQVLSDTKDYISKTFGPMGSNTKIVTGATQEQIGTSYSKDGLRVLKSIINQGPIEASIIEELVEVTRHVEKEVGDGTTSTVILSSLIFDNLLQIQKKYNMPPYRLMRCFGWVVDELKKIILDNGKDCTLDDIYNIAWISTNGNEEVSQNIKDIYERFGMDVDLTVGISTSEDSVIKSYDGLVITEGMSDPAFISNVEDNTAEIPNAHVYHFSDPIDTVEMIGLFDSIINHNIYEPLQNDEMPTPTVITCPQISRDTQNILKKLTQMLYRYDNVNAQMQKPPILIVTNCTGSDELIMDDIANLCGCKSIHKYIDYEVHNKEVEAGEAPTFDNVHEFYGECQLVVADMKKTKFINPKHMHSEDGEEDPVYRAMLNFLETEIDKFKDVDNASEKGLLKKRLAALKSNTVDYLVGGITVSDRDALKDLVEDAIKNCRSAANSKVGYAANFEGLRACIQMRDNDNLTLGTVQSDILDCITKAYIDITTLLYSTVERDEEVLKNTVADSIENGKPYDISSGVIDSHEGKDNPVKCSIMLDINILDTISKIITMMVTCNQCLLQAPQLNNY